MHILSSYALSLDTSGDQKQESTKFWSRLPNALCREEATDKLLNSIWKKDINWSLMKFFISVSKTIFCFSMKNNIVTLCYKIMINERPILTELVWHFHVRQWSSVHTHKSPVKPQSGIQSLPSMNGWMNGWMDSVKYTSDCFSSTQAHHHIPHHLPWRPPEPFSCFKEGLMWKGHNGRVCVCHLIHTPKSISLSCTT